MTRATCEPDRLAVVVGSSEASSAIGMLRERGLLDKRRKIVRRGGMVEIPVLKEIEGMQIVEQQSPEHYIKMQELSDLLDGSIPEPLKKLLPRGWFILGDTIIVRIHPDLSEHKRMIGTALLRLYPRCRCVLADKGVRGQFREPCREVIAGRPAETIHRENGVLFKLDPMRIMFSQGNVKERMRMASLGKDEIVVDMFAGIGYFSLPMAVHSRPYRITAIEINPVAHRYLVENIRLNHVEDIVEPVLGDCAVLTPEGDADRVIMGMVGITDRYLRKGIEALRPGGILHYHQNVPAWQYPDALIRPPVHAAALLGRSAEPLGCHKIKKYAPGIIHGVADIRIC
ncbi:MAG TPA: class I SAM-dependent methyltransferase family protein [Methanothrix sp.]|nr:class I SAM-dependent methyltransferase family protein [Methanothrix sp.]HOK57730.1 class I SAM-dependent methyltransferase family protein [Methanothrix sp.]HOL43133.1 class I SAM-dependent methyltransferase family protein [Methanothrix sp.]HPO88135.1 class I SAM-dependent methyltransferase family protein [Methanothrix sp.]